MIVRSGHLSPLSRPTRKVKKKGTRLRIFLRTFEMKIYSPFTAETELEHYLSFTKKKKDIENNSFKLIAKSKFSSLLKNLSTTICIAEAELEHSYSTKKTENRKRKKKLRLIK